jgi:DnaJ-class molecular chaperone
MGETILARAWTAFKAWGNTIPDCPSCGGTGEDTRNMRELVYWKGRIERVCYQCKGAGKV